MPIKLPVIDDKRYKDILNDAIARIPVHNPEWTNYNDSDPGITLLQLFAFMSESLLYRSNLIPERNRLKFLQLLGIPLQPATPAKAIITFSNLKGPVETVTIPPDVEVYAGKVPFRTDKGLDIIPVEANIYYKRKLDEDELNEEQKENYKRLYESLLDSEQEISPIFYQTQILEKPKNNTNLPSHNITDAVDSSLWIALLARSAEEVEITRDAIANKIVSIGIMPDLSASPRVLTSGNIKDEEKQFNFQFLIPSVQENGSTAQYVKLETRQEGDIAEKPGIVEVMFPRSDKISLWKDIEPVVAGSGDFPPAIEDTNLENRIVTWLRVKIPDESTGEAVSVNMQMRINWIGINAMSVIQKAHINGEIVGKGNGEPDQTFQIANIPVIINPPEKFQLTVNNESWEMIDDINAADPENLEQESEFDKNKHIKVFQVDPESGQIKFGDGFHGKRPPEGAVIKVNYDYGGGSAGQVGIGAINKVSVLPAYIKVTNEIPCWDGIDAQKIKDAEKSINKYIRHQERCITKEDFYDITRQTPGVYLGRVEILPLINPQNYNQASPGTVTVLVIPEKDRLGSAFPEPDQMFLNTICDYLENKRLITTEIHIIGPDYVDIAVSFGIEVIAGNDFATVRESVKAQIKKYLSPLLGGRIEKGWPLETNVIKQDLAAEATRVDGVAYVNETRLFDASGEIQDEVKMDELQLPRLTAISVSLGSADQISVDSLTTAPPVTGGVSNIFPVPVIPDICKC